ncbi:MAG: XdhC family protein [Chloroflexota bacterium]
MREVWTDVETWRRAGIPTALATVIQVSGSSLRPQGARMAVSAAGAISGSVSGGCVEGAVYEEAQAVLCSGLPRRLAYGVSDAAAWEVGLSCGGSIQVWVESLEAGPWQAVLPGVRECLEGGRLAALVSVVGGPAGGPGGKLLLRPDGDPLGDLGSDELNRAAAGCLPAAWAARDPQLLRLPEAHGGTELYIEYIAPLPRLVIVGAAHIAIPLVTLARTLGFHTSVVDARAAFATRERFPHVDELIVGWPAEILKGLRLDAAACVVCLSHDEKLDNPALQTALESPAGYIGALGSRTTHARRLEALRECGLNEAQLQRIHAPVGLKLGARTPEEIALAILAEIVALRHAAV